MSYGWSLEGAVELFDLDDKIVDARSVGTVGPLAVVTDAIDFVVEADGAALRYVGLSNIKLATVSP